VKLAPNVPDIGEMAAVAVGEGADGLTLVNTMPGLLFDLVTRRPVLGNGSGGTSGAGMLPIGVHAVAQARRRVQVPLLGAGGVRSADDVVQYLLAGANLVQIGSALFADPRLPLRVLNDLGRYLHRAGHGALAPLIGSGLRA
jgi:dihydroorotate dehydrogenase